MGLALVGVGFSQTGKGLGVEIYGVVRRLLFLYQFFMWRIFCWSIDARREREREKRRTSLRKGKSQPSDDKAPIQLYPPSIGMFSSSVFVNICADTRETLFEPREASFPLSFNRENRSPFYISLTLFSGFQAKDNIGMG